MKGLFVFACVLSIALAMPAKTQDEEAEELARQQAESAQYSFDSTVQDEINDSNIQRSETREGTKTSGMYSYSDGYIRRTVHYEADENGYRVVNEEQENIGEGPVFNPAGQADVSGSLIGQYSIKLDTSDNEKHYKDVNSA